jgi:hypothetical protein
MENVLPILTFLFATPERVILIIFVIGIITFLIAHGDVEKVIRLILKKDKPEPTTPAKPATPEVASVSPINININSTATNTSTQNANDNEEIEERPVKNQIRKKPNANFPVEDIFQLLQNAVRLTSRAHDQYLVGDREYESEKLHDLIRTLTLSFSTILEEKNIDDPEIMIEYVTLYLDKDITKIFSRRLERMRERSLTLTEKSEIKDELPEYTTSAIKELREKINNYTILSKSLRSDLYTIIENKSTSIKDTFNSIIKEFLRLTVEEQKEIIDICKNHSQQVKEKLIVTMGLE